MNATTLSWAFSFLTLVVVVGLIGFLSPKDVTLGGDVIVDAKTAVINTVRSDLQKGGYKQYKKGELDSNTYVHEYKNESGSGYQIFEEEMRADGLYRRSYGEGSEAQSRSFDWKLVEPVATSSKI